jgi:hypothetical protein
MRTETASSRWLEGWDWKDRVAFGMAALVATICLLALAFQGLWPADWKPEVWSATVASWVQAVGSVLGILAGVLTVRYQLHAQRREADERAKSQDRLRLSRSLQMLFASTIHGKIALASVKKILERPEPRWRRVVSALEDLSASIGYITADEFPSPGVAVLLKGLRLVIAAQLQIVREVIVFIESKAAGDGPPNVEEPRASIQAEIDGLIDAYQRIENRLGEELSKVATRQEQVDLFDVLNILKEPVEPNP